MSLFNLFRKPAPPPFRHKFDVPAIPAGGTKEYRLSGDLRQYRSIAPFTFLFVQNMSAVDIAIRFNYNPNNEIECVSKGNQTSSSIPFCNFIVINQNQSTAINAGEITVWIEKV